MCFRWSYFVENHGLRDEQCVIFAYSQGQAESESRNVDIRKYRWTFLQFLTKAMRSLAHRNAYWSYKPTQPVPVFNAFLDYPLLAMYVIGYTISKNPVWTPGKIYQLMFATQNFSRFCSCEYESGNVHPHKSGWWWWHMQRRVPELFI